MNVEVFIILLLTAIACVILGVFLFLRNLSMMTDAMSHTILLGIVIGFLIAQNLQTPLFVIGGVIVGVLSSWLINALKNTKKVNEDAAIGVVFPLLFGTAVILLTIFAKNVHLDLDAVLLGEVIFAPLSRFTILGISLPIALWWMLLSVVVNSCCITLFYKELKVSSFDPVFATLSGFTLGILQYGLMTLVSFTAVVAFDAVGSILVIALMIGPVMSARLLADNVGEVIVASLNIALITCILGYALAIYLDVSIAGMIAAVIGATFLLVVCIAPQKGILTRLAKRRRNRRKFETELLLLHLQRHQSESRYNVEAGVHTILNHLHWSEVKFQRISQKLLVAQEIEIKEDIYYLTVKGKQRAEAIMQHYELAVLR